MYPWGDSDGLLLIVPAPEAGLVPSGTNEKPFEHFSVTFYCMENRNQFNIKIKNKRTNTICLLTRRYRDALDRAQVS